MTTLTLQPNETNSYDTFIKSQAGPDDWNFGIGSNLQVGGEIATSSFLRTLIKFDLSSIPSGAVINSAVLRLRCVGAENSNSNTYYARRSLVQWYEGNSNGGVTGAGVDASTWNHRNHNGSVAWSGGAGGGAGSDYENSFTVSAPVQSAGADIDWNVLTDVGNFYRGVHPNYGWWLMGTESGYDGSKTFASSSGSPRPSLIITYTIVSPQTQEAAGVTDSVSVQLDSYPLTVQDVVNVVENRIIDHPFKFVEVQEAIALAENVLLKRGYEELSVGQAIALADTIIATLASDSSSQETVSLSESIKATLVNLARTQDSLSLSDSPAVTVEAPTVNADVVTLTDTPSLFVVPIPGLQKQYAMPLLYLTNGQYENGRLARFNFLSKHSGFTLCGWEPTIAQQKNGGLYTESNLVSGRRLVSFAYENPVEVLTLLANGYNQNRLIQYTRDLFDWLERAAEFWTSRFAKYPIYLVARSAYETETRYAVIYNASIPKLQNFYAQGFYNASNPFFSDVEVYLERGHWLDHPPNESECVSLSTSSTWSWPQAQIVEEGGGSGGGGGEYTPIPTGTTVYALIEADNGTILAGTGTAGKIYKSTDDGRVWSLLATIGTGSDRINAFTKDGSGNLYAAVNGATAVGGVWRSTDNGVTWTRVLGGTVTSVNGREIQDWQCYDILFAPATGYLHAVGDGYIPNRTPSPGRAPTFADSLNGTTWQSSTAESYYAYRAVGIALDRGIWPNVLITNYTGPTSSALIYYSSFDHVTQGFSGTFLGPYGYGTGNQAGFDIIGWGSGLPYPQPYNLIASVKNADGMKEVVHKLFLSSTYVYSPITSAIFEPFLSLYADPSTDNPNKGVYAGGDGTVYISQNGGYAWSTLTTSPTGMVHCFLRTDTSMLAGGEDGIILLEGGDLPSGSPPSPAASEGDVIQAQTVVGQASVCGEPGVYIGNQHFESGLTNILRYDDSSGSYTELYPMTEFPVRLLPTTPAEDDAIYFGSQSDMSETDAGPFTNIVFNLSDEQLGQDMTITWEYWSGSAWSLLFVQDETINFTAFGVRSVSWQIATADWSVTNVEGVLGWWVRARISSVGSDPQSPYQLNLNVFTANNTFAEIEADDIGGDIPALSQIIWQNAGDKNNGATVPYGYIDRLLVGLRSYNYGPTFNSIINISDQQVPFGFTLTAGAYSSWVDQGLAPTGRALYTVFDTDTPTAEWQTLVTIDIDSTIAENYYSTFRALARCYNPDGADDDWRLRLSVRYGSGGTVRYSKNYPYVSTTNAWHVVDFGSITIPSEQATINNIGDSLQLIIQGWGASEDIPLYLFDLILIPTEEWSVDVLRPTYSAGEINMRVAADNYIDINSLLTKAKAVVGTNRLSNGLVKADYQVITNGKGILQTNAKQRLWFFAMTQVDDGAWVAYPHVLGRVKVNRIQRYKAVRGVS